MPDRSTQVKKIRARRFASLLLASQPETCSSVADVVRWFGAIQGQDLGSLAWSLGLRTGLSRTQVDSAFVSGEVLRTWPMRGTLHVVPAVDARWMVEHLGARALHGARKRWEFLGLDERDAHGALDVLAGVLAGKALTRAECIAELEDAGISGAGQRGYHMLWYASQRGLTCMGPLRGTEQTFVLLDDFVPESLDFDRVEALAVTATRFVRSHGPVSVHDLARWADLPMADARRGIAAAEGVVSCELEGRELYVADSDLDAGEGDLPHWALPGFDELILGYRDRTAQLNSEYEKLIVPGGNGVFAPTLVVDGRVVGSWKRRELAKSVRIVATPYEPIMQSDRMALESRLRDFGDFVGKHAVIAWSDVE